MRLVLLGPPGVGKGTLAVKLAEKMGIPAISTGDLFRKAISDKSDLGRKLSSILERGDLVPDDITIGIVKERFKRDDAKAGFILDGFPRTIVQAKALSEIVRLDSVINLIAEDSVVIRRLSGRRICKRCGTIYHIKYMPPKKENVCDRDNGELYIRDDDKVESIKNRLSVYRALTEPLIKYYENLGLKDDIDASASPEKVMELVQSALGVST